MKQANILFILTDQQRHDTIGALGAPWMRTPHLDALAGRGAAFTSAYCAGAGFPGWRHSGTGGPELIGPGMVDRFPVD